MSTNSNKIVKKNSGFKPWVIFLIFISALLVLLGFAMFIVQFLPSYYGGISKETWTLFVGSLIGGVAAFVAIIISYLQTNKIHNESIARQDEEKILSIRPFITITPDISNLNPQINTNDNTSITVEYNGGDDMFSSRIGGPERNSDGDPIGKVSKWLRFKLQNIGNNSAHSLSIKINNNEVISGIVLGKGELANYEVYILNLPESESSRFNLNFEIAFSDLNDNTYYQIHKYEGGLVTKYGFNLNIGVPIRLE